MEDLLAARAQMAMSLGFHIIFACVGMAMPLLMVIAERRYLRSGDPIDLELAKRWSKGTAILFAVGAVSGTALSFELGLLWPKFMAHAGPVVGMPFSLEGFAFFLEAIFLGIYLYGWDKISPKWHLWSGVGVMICGLLSAIFVLAANAWMNTPTGFIMENGEFTGIDPWEAMNNPAWFTQSLHMVLAAFVSVGFAVAAIHAWVLLKHDDANNDFHRRAFSIALTVGAVSAFLQPISGDLSAKHVAKYQPAKLAAMEGQFEDEKPAPLRIGGWPDEEAAETTWAIEIPYLLSFLATGDPHAEIKGLKSFPRDEWPPVAIVHIAFQIMVGCGLIMMGVGGLFFFLRWRRKALPLDPWFLKMVVFSGPLGFIAVEAGWTVTEVGRQPWVIYNIMRTSDAVTPMPHLTVPFLAFTVLYAFLAVIVVVLLKRMVFVSPGLAEASETTAVVEQPETPQTEEGEEGDIDG